MEDMLIITRLALCSACIALSGLIYECEKRCNAATGLWCMEVPSHAVSHSLVVCCRKHLQHVLSFRFERPAIIARARRGEIGGEHQEALASPGVVQFIRERARGRYQTLSRDEKGESASHTLAAM